MDRSSNKISGIRLLRKGSCIIISFLVFVACSIVFNGWKFDPGSPKNFVPSNEYKKDVVQGEKDRIEFEEIMKRIEARKEKEQKEFSNRSSAKTNGSNVKGQYKDTTPATSTPNQEEKVIKVKPYVKPKTYETNSDVTQIPQEQIQQQPQQKKPKQMVRYNDWVDEPEGNEIKNTLENASHDNVIKEEKLIRIDPEDQQR